MSEQPPSLSEIVAQLETQAAELRRIGEEYEATTEATDWDAAIEKARSLPGTEEQRLILETLTAMSRNSSLDTRQMNLVMQRVVNVELALAHVAARVQELSEG